MWQKKGLKLYLLIIPFFADVPQHTNGCESMPHCDSLAKFIASVSRVKTASLITLHSLTGRHFADSLLGVMQGSPLPEMQTNVLFFTLF